MVDRLCSSYSGLDDLAALLLRLADLPIHRLTPAAWVDQHS
jgi:hypothetical protein